MARSHTTTAQTNQESKPVARQEIRPLQPARIKLGDYTDHDSPIGFSIEFEPAPDPKKSVVTQIISIGTPRKYRLVCLTENYGLRPVTITIRRLLRSHTPRNNDNVYLHQDDNAGCLEVAVNE